MKISQYAQESILNEICFVIREIGEFEFSNFHNFENLQFSDPPLTATHWVQTPRFFFKYLQNRKILKVRANGAPRFSDMAIIQKKSGGGANLPPPG